MWHDLSYLGPFDLAASTRFLEGFAPAAAAPGEPGRLRLAFPAAPPATPAS